MNSTESTESVEFEKYFCKSCIRTHYLLCSKPGCYHSTSTTHVRDRIFKLNPIHASMIIIFPEFTEFSESSAPFRKNSIIIEFSYDENPFCEQIFMNQINCCVTKCKIFPLEKRINLKF